MFLWPLHFIAPGIMMLVGWLLKRRPSSASIGSDGYSTPASCRSQAAWDHAQATAPGIFLGLGALAAGVIAMVDLLSLSPAIAAVGTGPVAYGIGATALVSAFFLVEHSLWEQMDQEDEGEETAPARGPVR